jgi:hypothetical protein
MTVGGERHEDSVESVLDTGRLDILAKAIIVLVYGLQPSCIVVGMRNDVYLDFF